MKKKEKVRKFESGATRDQDNNKLDYEGFLSPLVLKRYAEYMNNHRYLSDGSLRDSDNWQKLFGKHHLDVCMKSKMRHDMNLWLNHRGFNGESMEDIEDACCAIIFNTMAYLFKVLKDKEVKK